MRWNKNVAGWMLIFPVSVSAQTSSSPPSPGLVFESRLRYETVEDKAFTKDADALTARLRVGFRSPAWSGWSLYGDLEHTFHLGDEDFNSTANGKKTYPTVADPDNSELNQLYVNYALDKNNRLTVGRQRLIYDNQRFFGNVGWRQNEQTFDAVDAFHKFGNGWSVRYSYLDRVQRVFGGDNPDRNQARWNLNAHLLSANVPLGPGSLTGYVHFIDNETLPLTSHRNLGLRYTAKKDVPDGIGWQYALEYTNQQDYADGASKIDADYLLAEGSLIWKKHTFKAGWEVLSGDGNYGFQAPFGTLHAFNGWADKFLTTPVNGLHDVYVSWSHKFGDWTAQAAWHDYQSDYADLNYGQEWNTSLGWNFAKKWNALAKVARYDADDFAKDTNKFWLSVEYVY